MSVAAIAALICCATGCDNSSDSDDELFCDVQTGIISSQYQDAVKSDYRWGSSYLDYSGILNFKYELVTKSLPESVETEYSVPESELRQFLREMQGTTQEIEMYIDTLKAGGNVIIGLNTVDGGVAWLYASKAV